MSWMFNVGCCCNSGYLLIAVIDESTPYAGLTNPQTGFKTSPSYLEDLELWNEFLETVDGTAFPWFAGVVIPSDFDGELSKLENVAYNIKANDDPFPELVSYHVSGFGTSEERITVDDIATLISIIQQDHEFETPLTILGSKFWLDDSGSLSVGENGVGDAVDDWREQICNSGDVYLSVNVISASERWLKGLAEMGQLLYEKWEADEVDPNCEEFFPPDPPPEPEP